MKELFTLAFILTAPAASSASDESAAYQAIAQASYKQSGIEANVDRFVERELRHVPKELQSIVGNMYLIGKTLQERKVGITWTF